MNSQVSCYTIPPALSFLDSLGEWLLERYGSDAAGLAEVRVLLPNRRACRSLQEALLRLGGGRPMLLPRIQPLGDMEDNALWWQGGADIPAGILPMRRRLLLTELVRRFEGQRSGRTYDVVQAAELARELAGWLDEVAREGVPLENLSGLVPDTLAAHWQQTLDFLRIISVHWPEVLRQEGVADPVERRNRLLLVAARSLAAQPPAYPIIAAGSTGSQPATAALLGAIAKLPQGAVILPGLDLAMSEREWHAITETHPQFGMRQLLAHIDCPRSEVKVLKAQADTPRTQTLRAIFSPPDITADWRHAQLPLSQGLAGVRLIEAETPLEEARLIAVQLREVLDTPGKTAALVTPDRTLARLVAAQLSRFGITVDDSAGRPLADTPVGVFLRLLSEMAASQASPAGLLALLRHPLAAVGRDTAECRRLSRELELRLLRGIRISAGLKPLHEASRAHAELEPFLRALMEQAESFLACFEHNKDLPLSTLLALHIDAAQRLAATPDESGEDRLWCGEAGNAAAALIAEMMQHAEVMEPVSPRSYPGLLESLLKEAMYWPRFGQHPRLSILSPLEARLQQADRVIIGGLNEDAWPASVEADPWMSRPMRQAFGLVSPERVVGQSAHDVFMLAMAEEVVLTRARKVEGTPAVPSRWLVRLRTLVEGLSPEIYASLADDSAAHEAVTQLDRAQELPPLAVPSPSPPASTRPRELNVTEIELLMRDPYMIYARHVLWLKALKPLDKEPGADDFGIVVHKALEHFTRAYPSVLPENALAELLKYGQVAFAEFIDRPAVASVWWPRFEAMAEWLLGQEHIRRGGITSVESELKGHWKFMLEGDEFTLKTRIDRLELRKDGSATIIDYKTGGLPKKKDIDEGLASQLPLEMLVATQGELKVRSVGALEYWKLAGNHEHCEIRDVAGDMAVLAEATRTRLMELLARYTHAPYQAQESPSLLPRHNDYEHLTRRQEWQDV